MWVVAAAKAGSGCTVVAAAIALLAARGEPTLMVDLGGDLPAVLGIDDGTGSAVGLGVGGWLQADEPPPDALARAEVPVCPGLSLVPAGGTDAGEARVAADVEVERIELLARILAAEQRRVVVDVGIARGRYEPLIRAARRSILVSRNCYLSLRRTLPPVAATDLVLIREPGRALRPADVAGALGQAVAVTLPWDPAVARSVDAGLLASRLPRSLRALGGLIDEGGGARQAPGRKATS